MREKIEELTALLNASGTTTLADYADLLHGLQQALGNAQNRRRMADIEYKAEYARQSRASRNDGWE